MGLTVGLATGGAVSISLTLGRAIGGAASMRGELAVGFRRRWAADAGFQVFSSSDQVLKRSLLDQLSDQSPYIQSFARIYPFARLSNWLYPAT